MTQDPLTHFDAKGAPRMVDVSGKDASFRQATAEARIRMRPETLQRILEGDTGKGDVRMVAQLAGIMAAKKTADLIPLCHPLALSAVDLEIEALPDLPGLRLEARCALNGRTGVEMEALTAATVAALTVYDMCKAMDRAMVIESVRLVEKQGGQSGHWRL